jgi:hypothetical protein
MSIKEIKNHQENQKIIEFINKLKDLKYIYIILKF